MKGDYFMKLTQLEYFQTLAKILHYTKAAQVLHISQPSLSYAIASLEKELGVELFAKNGRNITLSPYGETFLEYINQALDILDQGVKAINSIQVATTGEVSIGYIYSLSTSIVPKIVENFKKNEDNAGIKFTYTQNLQKGLLEDLKTGKIDLALCADIDSSVVSVPIIEQELFLVVANGHPLANKKAVTFKSIANLPFILLHEDSALRKKLNLEFKKINVIPNIVAEAQECSATLQYVAHNSGVTIVPQVPGLDYLPVTKIKIKTPGFSRKIYLSWVNTHHPMPPVRKVRNYILEIFMKKETIPPM
ncbi:HTH-type transcriptional regulator GltC [bioreactor metagenome]|uniref:HTH-type transcriptional regulator GltC n=1 Tax=bioreactor metagenome TaxID=1076179 RepID=A0A644UIX6_9ZZZZ